MTAGASKPGRKTAIGALRRYARDRSFVQDDLRALAEGRIIEMDRASAIVSGARVDDALTFALKRRMRTLTQSEEDALFLGDSVLGSFSAKIRVGYAFSLFGVQTRDDLDLIREIRNAFAHCDRPIDFNVSVVANCCSLLKLCERNPAFKDPDDMKMRFNLSCVWVYLALTRAAHHVIPEDEHAFLLP